MLSISYLKEIFKQSATSKQPHEVFDIICGTRCRCYHGFDFCKLMYVYVCMCGTVRSTGGIIAVMLGSQRLRLPETEALYDRFIDRVFGQKSNIKLVCMYVCILYVCMYLISLLTTDDITYVCMHARIYVCVYMYVCMYVHYMYVRYEYCDEEWVSVGDGTSILRRNRIRKRFVRDRKR